VAGVGELNNFVPEGTMENGGFFQRPFRTRGFAGASPTTMWLANFRRSFGAKNVRQKLAGKIKSQA
jgi:hypothetical protein